MNNLVESVLIEVDSKLWYGLMVEMESKLVARVIVIVEAEGK